MSQDIHELAAVHAKSIVAGHFDKALLDFGAELAPKVPSMVPLLPKDLKDAEVVSITPRGSDHVVHIRYDGAEASATVESIWREEGGRPKIVEARFL
jgi:hypothetical protein